MPRTRDTGYISAYPVIVGYAVTNPTSAEYLVIAGGGGGGDSLVNVRNGAGAGAGG